ncbi:MAG: hypothetical protein ACNS60_02595 [Candidatus Cyclobacteriaceae bacterium M2_1C_046]
MKTSTLSNAGTLKYAMVLITFLLLSLFQNANAQEKEWEESTKFTYTGLEASFGLKAYKIVSSIPEIQNDFLLQEGGSIGMVFGNDYSRFIIKPLGFYSATGSYARTINLFTVEAENNTYLLQAITKKSRRFDIYSSLGMNFQSFKFFGHYIDKDQRPSYNNKAGKEPFLGKIENFAISYGMGVEYRLLHNEDFVHLFLTGKSSLPIQSSTNSDIFKETHFERHFELQFGVRFGLQKYSKPFTE